MTRQRINLVEDEHFRLDHKEDRWEWFGLGPFSEFSCETSYSSKNKARNAAVKTLLRLLNSEQ